MTTFGEFKKQHPSVNPEAPYWNHSITIPDHAVVIDAPSGMDVDGDTHGDKFVCFAYGNWWAWPLKYYGLAEKVRNLPSNFLKESE